MSDSVFETMRRAAERGTDGHIARLVLARFPRLVAHAGASGVPGMHYQDFDERDEICATAGECEALYWIARLGRTSHKRGGAGYHILEIGSYIGWTGAFLAAGSGGAASFVTLLDARVRERLRENIAAAVGGEDFYGTVRIVEGRSPEAVKENAPDGGWNLVFVDGYHHGEQPSRDAAAAVASLAPGGAIAFHDVWIPEVRRAVNELADSGFTGVALSTPNYLTVMFRARPVWFPAFVEIARGLETEPAAAARSYRLQGLAENVYGLNHHNAKRV